MPPVMMVDDKVEALSDEQFLTAFFRATKSANIPARWESDGTVTVLDEDADLDSDEFIEFLDEELKRVIAAEMLDGAVAAGMIRPGSVNADGEIGYFPVD